MQWMNWLRKIISIIIRCLYRSGAGPKEFEAGVQDFGKRPPDTIRSKSRSPRATKPEVAKWGRV